MYSICDNSVLKENQASLLSNFMTACCFLLALLMAKPTLASDDIHVVFDLDWTLINPTSSEMVKMAPLDTFELEGKVYRFSQHMIEVLIALHQEPNVKVSYFSGGTEQRNIFVINLIYEKLKARLGHDQFKPFKVLSKNHLTEVSKDPSLEFSERFKKDLSLFFDLKSVLLVDDIKNFVPLSQAKNQLWLGKTYNDRPEFNLQYLEKIEEKNFTAPNKSEWIRNRDKLLPIKEILLGAIRRTRGNSQSFVDNIVRTCAGLF